LPYVLLKTSSISTIRAPSALLRKFAATARQRMRIEGGGYRSDHLRALAQRVEVADREVRIMGSKSDLLRTLAAISGVKSATGGVRSSALDWRRE
jgi:site-specific DNA recombinase